MGQTHQQVFQAILELLEDMIRHQQGKVLRIAQEVNPRLTPDDLLLPEDFPELKQHPLFDYEDGVLAGLRSAQAAIRSLRTRL